MTLAKEVKVYTASKQVVGHDRVKKDFFNQIAILLDNKQLTGDLLTRKLAALSAKQRACLFYRGRAFGPSIHSHAAQLIIKLYQHCGSSINEKMLNHLIHEPIYSPNPSRNTLTECNNVYRFWLRNPFSPWPTARLENALSKIFLSVIQNDENNENLSLFDLLLRENVLITTNWLDLGINLPKLIPQYLPVLFDKLARENSCLNILAIVEKNPNLLPFILETNIELAQQIVEHWPEQFFNASSTLQEKLYKRLRSNSDVLNQINSYVHQKFIPFTLSTDLRLQALNINDKDHQCFIDFQQTIKSLIPQAAELYQRDQYQEALKIINDYLALDPGNYKRNFFTQLQKKIKQQQNFNLSLLQEELKQADRTKLFAKMIAAPKHCRAAKVMKALYKVASFGREFNDDFITETNLYKNDTYHMIYEGKLPELRDEESAQIFAISDQIKEHLLHPENMKKTFLGRHTEKVINYFQAQANFYLHQLAANTNEAEVIYQNFLINKGIELAKARPIFDPQGHVLVEVSLEESDIRFLIAQITGKYFTEVSVQQLGHYLGSPNLTATTLCKLDVSADPLLKQGFVKKLLLSGTPINNNNNLSDDKYVIQCSTIIEQYLNSPERNSVIALQEEMMAHVLLCARSLAKKEAKLKLTRHEKHDLNLVINQHTMAIFAELFKKIAFDEQSAVINFARLNQLLDAARPALAATCRQLLVTILANKVDEEEVTRLLADLNQHDFTSTTATGIDYLRSDAINYSVVRISATNDTAHDKKLGANHQALRVIARNHYDVCSLEKVYGYKDNNTTARVPSIAVRQVSHQASVQDVAAKLEQSFNLLQQKAQGYHGPLIYNLLTSLHSKLYDISIFESKNKQRMSAARILKGSHLFNKQQIERGQFNNLVFIQNIPVNQHTNSLDLNARDEATAEAALMTKVALLATFNHHKDLFPPLLKKSIGETYYRVHRLYLNFLEEQGDGFHYFKNSEHGKNVITDLHKIQTNWQMGELNAVTDTSTMQNLITQALFKMMTLDLHQNKQFGMMVQAFSVFIEPLSMAGCKSGNERYQAVNGRSELLNFMNGTTIEQKELHQALVHFVNERNNVDMNILQEKLDKAYNKHNLQGACAAFSLEDQGASSKVTATKNNVNPGLISEYDTNVAETGFLTNLWQKFSSCLQAHKANLVGIFKNLFADKMKERSNSAPSF